jgi:membrane-associated phospholipid phosphatase
MTLPLFIHRNNYIFMALLCGLAFFFGYEVPNHFHLYPPQQLRLTEFDRWVPFMPWSVLVYTSEYFLFATAYFALDDDENRNRYIWAYFGVLAVGAVFFVFFPTTYPRAEFPLPTNINPFIYSVFNSLRRFDDPSNCFPSMHVTCCYITAFAFLPRNESRKKFWIYFIWATLISASTLPTKQHYLADVMGGLVLSISGYWVFFKKVRYVPLSEYTARFRATFSRAES